MQSEGKYKLNPRSSRIVTLHELITVRNKIVHIDEDVHVFTELHSDVSIEDNKLKVSLTLPKSPWQEIGLKQVQGYRDSVNAYFEQVLFPSSGTLRIGDILAPKN